MSPRVRLVATDLDGTLLRSDGSVSSATVEVLAELERAGIVVVFVTARPVRWVRELASMVHGHGMVICANGAVVYDARERAVLSASVLPVDVLRHVVGDIRQVAPTAAFAREALSGFGKEPDYPERHPTPAGSPVGPIEELVADDVVKLLVRDDSMAPDVLFAAVVDAVGMQAEVTTSDGSGVVEISAAGVNKAATLAAFCADRGIDASEVIAFGDMLNDLPMLGWAGTSVAVANAHPEVLALADVTTSSNDDDGVAAVLRDLL
jgi:Cof subfamily protein (haloacid dehalogenase superfamily)